VSDDPFAMASDIGKVRDVNAITGGRYRLPELVIGDGGTLLSGTEPRKGGWTRVTTMAGAIGAQEALRRWETRLVAIGLIKRPDLYDLACGVYANTPEEKLREALQPVVERALLAANADAGGTQGTAFHYFTDAQDRGAIHYAHPSHHGKLSNYRDGMISQGLKVVPEWVERQVVILGYGLAGTVDRILRDIFNDVIVIGDLKSQKKFWTWMEIAAQLAAYAMADAMWDREKLCYVEMPKISQESAIVAWMPMVNPGEDPDGVDFFTVDLERGRQALDVSAQVYAMRSEAKSVNQRWGMLRPAPSLTPVEAYARRLADVATRTEGSAVWAEVVKAGLADVPELLEVATARLALL
jgi:hypothetical protein